MAQEKRVHTMTIAGLQRDLPLCRLNEHMSIAAFVIFGDVEMTVASAAELLKRRRNSTCSSPPRPKGIPLVYEMARQSGKPYFIARKYPKLYMPNPISVQVRSITTDKEQTLYLDEEEMNAIRGKRVLIVDDVISTGESLHALGDAGGALGGPGGRRGAILAEGRRREAGGYFLSGASAAVCRLSDLPTGRSGLPASMKETPVRPYSVPFSWFREVGRV